MQPIENLYCYKTLHWHWNKIEIKRLQRMLPPGFEPGTFCVWDRRDNHYTTETAENMGDNFRLLTVTLSGARRSRDECNARPTRILSLLPSFTLGSPTDQRRPIGKTAPGLHPRQGRWPYWNVTYSFYQFYAIFFYFPNVVLQLPT